jgi:predicted ATP-dependent serine protease
MNSLIGAILSCNHDNCCEPKAFDKAREYQLNKIEQLKQKIVEAETRIKVIDNVDRAMFDDLQEYDEFIEAEQKRAALEQKITEAVNEQVKKLKPFWYVITSVTFDGTVYGNESFEQLVTKMKSQAIKAHSAAKVTEFVTNTINWATGRGTAMPTKPANVGVVMTPS